jgi:hypothetical protein
MSYRLVFMTGRPGTGAQLVPAGRADGEVERGSFAVGPPNAKIEVAQVGAVGRRPRASLPPDGQALRTAPHRPVRSLGRPLRT